MSSPDPEMQVDEPTTEAAEGARRSSRKRKAPENFMDAGKSKAVTTNDGEKDGEDDDDEDEEDEEDDEDSEDDANPPPKKRKTATTTTATAPAIKGGRGRPPKAKSSTAAPEKRSRAKTSTAKPSKSADTTGDGMVKDDNGLFSTYPCLLNGHSLTLRRRTRST